MVTKELTAFRIDSDLMHGLRVVKERDGILISEQVRRAIEAWLTSTRAAPGDADRAFDDFEDALTRTSNRGGALDKLKLPKEFGRSLGGKVLGSLTKSQMQVLDRFARAVGRPPRSYWDFWNKAVRQARDRRLRAE